MLDWTRWRVKPVVIILFAGIFTATPAAITALGATALAAAVVAKWRRRLNFLSLGQFIYGLSFIVISLIGSVEAGINLGLVRAVFLFSLSMGIALSLLPIARSLVDIIVSIRRFPTWFGATDLYRAMDMMYGIAWSALLLIGAVLLYFKLESIVKRLLIIGGLGSELLVFVMLRSHGYRYFEFLSGKPKSKES